MENEIKDGVSAVQKIITKMSMKILQRNVKIVRKSLRHTVLKTKTAS